MQNEIATKLASELKGGLDAAEAQQLVKKATENAEAQSEYQAGRREWNKRSKQGFENAIKHFERAIELDPSYADPYVGLGETYGLLSIYNFSPASEAMPKAKSYARQALEINPSFPGAYTSLAWVLHKYEYDWAGAEQNYRKAIELNPNHATANHWYGIFLFETRRGEKAVERIKIATQLAPNSKIIQHSYAEANWRIGRDADALKAAEKSLLIDPNFPFALRQKHVMLGMGTPEDFAALNSFFEDRSSAGRQTAELKTFLGQLGKDRKVLLVTHQVNVRALTGRGAASGEIVLLRIGDDGSIETVGGLLIDP